MLQETESQNGHSKGQDDQSDLETVGEPVFCTESILGRDCTVSIMHNLVWLRELQNSTLYATIIDEHNVSWEKFVVSFALTFTLEVLLIALSLS